jgi:hypothetical protein
MNESPGWEVLDPAIVGEALKNAKRRSGGSKREIQQEISPAKK